MAILSLNVISVIAGRCHGEKVKGMIFMGWNGGGAPGAFKRQLPLWGDSELRRAKKSRPPCAKIAKETESCWGSAAGAGGT